MNKEREIVYSRKGKAESEYHINKQAKHKPCKKIQCEGHEKQHTSRFHSEGKSQKPTKRKITKQKSQSKIEVLKSNEELNLLKQQYTQLQYKYQSRNKELIQLKSTLKNYEQQINQQNKLIKSFSKKSTAQSNKTVLNQAQVLTRQAIDKYKVLSQQFQQYKEEAEARLQSQKLKHQASTLRLKEQYERKINLMSSSSNKEHQIFKIKQQQVISQTDIKIYKQQIKRLRLQNQQLTRRIEEQEQTFRRKQNEFKNNLMSITERVQHWEQGNSNIQAIQQQNYNLRKQYQILAEKYARRKEKQQRKTQEWAVIFQQFLAQINKLKRQIELSNPEANERSFD